MIFDMNDNSMYKDPADVYEAFTSILATIGSSFFRNISFDSVEGVLEYDTDSGHCVKPFDLTQGTPEIVADVMQWLFSMLDAAANL